MCASKPWYCIRVGYENQGMLDEIRYAKYPQHIRCVWDWYAIEYKNQNGRDKELNKCLLNWHDDNVGQTK